MKISDPTIDYDTLVEILLRLPLKLLIRLTLVCKHWNALITNDSTFRRSLLSNQKPTALGLFIQSCNYHCKSVIHYHPFSLNNYIPFDFNQQDYLLVAQQTCNGLLLCSALMADNSKGYFVCNMTTKKMLLLPEPFCKQLIWSKPIAMYLAFDPKMSPFYKVVALMRWGKTDQIFIYSSDEATWREIGEPFPVRDQLCYKNGVYWNGSVHWINPWHLNSSYYFNVENETLRTMPSVPRNKSTDEADDGNDYYDRKEYGYYVGEAGGHLYYVETGFEQLQVYEMMTDYSNWIVRYNVCLPTSFRDYSGSSTAATQVANEVGEWGMPVTSWARTRDYHKMSVLSVVCSEDDTFLVLKSTRRVSRCSLVSDTCETIHDIPNDYDSRKHGPPRAFQYVESFCSV